MRGGRLMMPRRALEMVIRFLAGVAVAWDAPAAGGDLMVVVFTLLSLLLVLLRTHFVALCIRFTAWACDDSNAARRVARKGENALTICPCAPLVPVQQRKPGCHSAAALSSAASAACTTASIFPPLTHVREAWPVVGLTNGAVNSFSTCSTFSRSRCHRTW